MDEKIDFKKSVDAYRAERGKFRIVDVPATVFLMIDGRGDPNTDPSYAAALEALYPVAYSVKFMSKRELGRDYVVPPLECLWWAEDMSVFTGTPDKASWCWTAMLMVPAWITDDHLRRAVDTVRQKKAPERLDEIRVETFTEGLSVQTLHVGPFDEEGPVLERMHSEFIPDNGLRMTGRHHEVYFSDVRRAAPEKLRTLLRQPVEKRPATRPSGNP